VGKIIRQRDQPRAAVAASRQSAANFDRKLNRRLSAESRYAASGKKFSRDFSLSIRRQRQENFFKLDGVATLFAQFIACADGDQFSAVDNADAVGHLFGDAQLMRGDEHGQPCESAVVLELIKFSSLPLFPHVHRFHSRRANGLQSAKNGIIFQL
jgi:hypothetical protein